MADDQTVIPTLEHIDFSANRFDEDGNAVVLLIMRRHEDGHDIVSAERCVVSVGCVDRLRESLVK